MNISVSPLVYVENYMVKLQLIILCMLTVAIARSSSGSIAIHYVLPVFWMMSSFQTMHHMYP